MKKCIIIFYLFMASINGQYVTGNDLLSDMRDSNKNEVYVYWIGMVNGNIQWYEFGIRSVLNELEDNGMISQEEEYDIYERIGYKKPNNLTEQQIFKIVWKYINKHPEKRHMGLSKLTHMALQESF